MTNAPNIQGKLERGVNSYCINTTDNWNGCGANYPSSDTSRVSAMSLDIRQNQLKSLPPVTARRSMGTGPCGSVCGVLVVGKFIFQGVVRLDVAHSDEGTTAWVMLGHAF